MLGLPMCFTTNTHKYVNTNQPNKRGGLLRRNTEALGDGDNPFFNSVIDHYVSRPDSLEQLSLAEFCRDYNIVYKPRSETEADELYTIQDDDEYPEAGESIWLGEEQHWTD